MLPLHPSRPQVAESDTLDASTRQLAAEFLVTLCEAREKVGRRCRKVGTCSRSLVHLARFTHKAICNVLSCQAPGMMRKLPQFGERLFKCLVLFLLDVSKWPRS